MLRKYNENIQILCKFYFKEEDYYCLESSDLQ